MAVPLAGFDHDAIARTMLEAQRAEECLQATNQ
jgi:hypothetical protein